MEPPRKKRRIEKKLTHRNKNKIRLEKRLRCYKHVYSDFILKHFNKIIKAIKIQSVIRMFLVKNRIKKRLERTINYLDFMINFLELIVLTNFLSRSPN